MCINIFYVYFILYNNTFGQTKADFSDNLTVNSEVYCLFLFIYFLFYFIQHTNSTITAEALILQI